MESPRGPEAAEIAPRPDTAHRARSKLGEAGWGVGRAGEHQVLGLPQKPPTRPHLHNQGQSWGHQGAFLPSCALPGPYPCAGLLSPIPGSTPSHLRQAKHRQTGLRAGTGWEHKYDSRKETPPPKPPSSGKLLTCLAQCYHHPLQHLPPQQPPSQNPQGCRIP